MATGIVRLISKVTITRNGKLYGPFDYDISRPVDEAAHLVFEVADSTTLQLIGGVSPQISEIATVSFILIESDQDILVGFQGITIATEGFTLSANGVLQLMRTALTNVAVRNESGSTANVVVIIEGT